MRDSNHGIRAKRKVELLDSSERLTGRLNEIDLDIFGLKRDELGLLSKDTLRIANGLQTVDCRRCWEAPLNLIVSARSSPPLSHRGQLGRILAQPVKKKPFPEYLGA